MTALERLGGNYKFAGILEVDTIKQVEMMEKIRKEYHRRMKRSLETKLICTEEILLKR